MSLRYFAVHFTKNALYFIRQYAKRRHINILDPCPQNRVVPAKRHAFINSNSTLKTVGSAVSHHTRNAFIGDAVFKLPNEFKKRLTKRLFYGCSAPGFALIGITLSNNGKLLRKEDEEEFLCYKIQETVSKFPWDFDVNNPNELFVDGKISLDDLEIGNFISKGCSAVVYSAKVKDSSNNDVNVNQNHYPLAMKILFNYDIQSSSMAILKAMYKETIPAQICYIHEHLSYWRHIFQSQRITLPPHPNIITTYNAFADYMPNLVGSMQHYPDALPYVHNPSGLGRNMTLFLLMKRYQYSLREYLNKEPNDTRNSVLLFTQLLEGIIHLNKHKIAHRDLKADNLLIDEVAIGDSCYVPQLVITDFGCCIVDRENGLKLPYRSDNIDKGGNINLMAPEIISQQPGLFSFLDYRKSDLWAAGALAYEIFGYGNPFSSNGYSSQLLNVDYDDSQLPDMGEEVPSVLMSLIKNLLSKNPNTRLDPETAANVCQLYLWAPSSWLLSKLPSSNDILEWLLCLTTKIVCEARLFYEYSDCKNTIASKRNANPEYLLIASFLSRVRIALIKEALLWIHSINKAKFSEK